MRIANIEAQVIADALRAIIILSVIMKSLLPVVRGPN